MQGDLFELGTPGPVAESAALSRPQPSWLDRFRITLRVDHLAIIAISGLVLYVLIFSFGVEQGKRMAQKEAAAEKTRQEQTAKELQESQRLPVVPPLTAGSRELSEPATGTAPVHVPLVMKDGIMLRPLAGKYTIQVITFTGKKRAQQEVEKLKGKGFSSFIIPAGKYFQVCVDAFDEMSAARERLLKLKSEGFAPSDAYIRPYQAPIAL